MDVAREKLNSSVINSTRLKRFFYRARFEWQRFYIRSRWNFQNRSRSVNRYRIKREEQKKKKKQNETK